MKTISGWSDLRPFGIDALTGEACGLMYRVLFDVTERGLKIVEKCLGVRIQAAEPWNRGSDSDPHVGSIMLSDEMLVPIGVFALLESGCSEAWLVAERTIIGFDGGEQDERYRTLYKLKLVRTFRYAGTAGDRNVHQMSGRVT